MGETLHTYAPCFNVLSDCCMSKTVRVREENGLRPWLGERGDSRHCFTAAGVLRCRMAGCLQRDRPGLPSSPPESFFQSPGPPSPCCWLPIPSSFWKSHYCHRFLYLRVNFCRFVCENYTTKVKPQLWKSVLGGDEPASGHPADRSSLFFLSWDLEL